LWLKWNWPAICTKLMRMALCRVGLLGTRFVMEEQFYQGRLQERFGIEVLVPREEERATVHQIIYNELCQGKIGGLHVAPVLGLSLG